MATEKFLSMYCDESPFDVRDVLSETLTTGELIDFLKRYPADMKIVTKRSFMYGIISGRNFLEKTLD